MFDIEKIKSLFERYDYKLLDETSDYLVYAVGRSLYSGVEIVSLIDENSDTIKQVVSEYRSMNYSVRVCPSYKSDYIEDYLFDWFFQVEASNKKIALRYKEYTEGVMKAYGLPEESINVAKYEYIKCSYQVERDFRIEQSSGRSIIESIRSEIDSQGSKLMIVEAPAGYGKTSTAMELLNSFSNVKSGIRPFYMQLEKDRIAPTFYYLLISQINKTFDVLLGDNIVLYNIKQGRIPLIIDGFDELLSEDLDKGDSTKANKKGETMLSTIADLLVSNAKIVLTTRKTAILSGQEFLDWYQKKIQPCNGTEVLRYKLELPRINDWLNEERLALLPDYIRDLSNPVLLGYLHYLDIKEFKKECATNSLIVSYLNKLLIREQQRQSLPFTIEEQLLIFESLASTFAYCNVSSDTRMQVKDNIMLFSDDLIYKYATPMRDSSSLSNALTNHALIDRKESGNLGFINDFVMGILLGYSMIETKSKHDFSDYYKTMSRKFIDMVILSIAACGKDVRELVCYQLQEQCVNLTPELKFMSDVKLMRQLSGPYEGLYLDGYLLNSMRIGVGAQFEDCTFVGFEFQNCYVTMDVFRHCTFIGCRFNACNLVGNTSACDFYECDKDGSLFDPNQEIIDVCDLNRVDVATSDEVKWVDLLSHYFTKGSTTRRQMQQISRLRQDFPNPKEFKKLFNQVCRLGYILTNGDLSHISDSGVDFMNNHR